MRKLKKIISIGLIIILAFQQTGFAQGAVELNLASHLAAMGSSLAFEKFRPIHLRYLELDQKTGNFNLLLDKGSKSNELNEPNELNASTQELLKYFFIGLTLPNSSFWVNLRPDTQDNIIDSFLATTDIGKIFLEVDLKLKQDTANFTSPATPEGKLYWDKLYKKAAELFGDTSGITIPSITRPWIVPDEVIIRETPTNAYIYKATLKVMLEEDYLKTSIQDPGSRIQDSYDFSDPRMKALNQYASELLRELIIPKLNKAVNSSKAYAPLRQVYYSLILAQWYKSRFQGKDNPYAKLIDSNNLTHLLSSTPYSVDTYYNQYKTSFQKGEYNLKEQLGTRVRTYTAGGIGITGLGLTPVAPGQKIERILDSGTKVMQVGGTQKQTIRNTNLIPAQLAATAAIDVLTNIPVSYMPGAARDAIQDLAIQSVIEPPEEQTAESVGLGVNSASQEDNASFRVDPDVVMVESIAKGVLEARHIYPFSSVTDSAIEEKLKAYIVQVVNENKNRSELEVAEVYDGLVAEFTRQGIDLSRYPNLRDEFELAFRKAVAYANGIAVEELYLHKEQIINRFLKLDHPMVVALQEYLDKMADPNLPRARLLIAIDFFEDNMGKKNDAYSIGQSIVINLSLINQLKTVDEVVSILAHEQAHHEDQCKMNWPGINSADWNMQKRRARRAMGEVNADLIGAKLAKVGLNIFALHDVFSREKDQGRDFDHLNSATRSAYMLGAAALRDYQAGYSFSHMNIPIPTPWRFKKIAPNLSNRIFLKSYSGDFNKALSQVSLDFLRRIVKLIDNSSRKQLAIFREYVRRINQAAEAQDWSVQQRRVAILLLSRFNYAGDFGNAPFDGIFDGIFSYASEWKTWVRSVIRFGLSESGRPPSLIRNIADEFIRNRNIRQMAISLLKDLSSQESFLKSLSGKTILGELMTQEHLKSLATFLGEELVSDHRMASVVLGRRCSVRDRAYLVMHSEYLRQLSMLVPQEERQLWLEDVLARVIINYGVAYGKRRNKDLFIEQLRQANTHYRDSLGIDPLRLYTALKENFLWQAREEEFPVDYVELMNKLFNQAIEKPAKDTRLYELSQALEKRDGQLLLQYMQKCYNAGDSKYSLFYVLRRLDEFLDVWWSPIVIALPSIFRNPQRYPKMQIVSHHSSEDMRLFLKIKLMFKKDAGLSSWLVSLLQSQINNDQLHLGTDMQRFRTGLVLRRLIPVATAQDRWDMLRRYFTSDAAQEFIAATSTEQLESLDTGGFYFANIRDNPQGAGVPLTYYDLQLNLPLYQTLKERRLSQLRNAQSLSEARAAFQAVVNYSRTVYGISGRSGRLLGLTKEHEQWLLPVYQAFLEYLKDKLNLLETASKESIELYFILDLILNPTEEKDLILGACRKALIDELSDDDLKVFLQGLSERAAFDRDTYDYFIERRVKTKEQFKYFQDIMRQYMALVGSGNDGIGIAVNTDKFIDDWSFYSMTRNLFVSMMDSGKRDDNLKIALSFPWFLYLLSLGSSLGYRIEYIKGGLKVVGANQNSYVPFEEFVDSIYELPEAAKLGLLSKLLIGPVGLLNKKRGRRVFANIFAKQIRGTGELADLLTDILQASAKQLGGADLFLAFREPALSMFLRRPSQPSQPNFSRWARQMFKLHAQEVQLGPRPGPDELEGKVPYPLYNKRLLGPSHFKRFLEEYGRKKQGSFLDSAIGQLIESFSDQVKGQIADYYQEYAPKESVSGQPKSLASIDIIIEACQSLGPVGVRFLQVLGQYMPISEQDQGRFRDVYDASERQDRFIAFQTLFDAIDEQAGRKVDPLLKRYVNEDLVSLDRRIGGGAIVTVFEVSVRNRDERGNLVEGTHKEVLKIRNPNASAFTQKVVNAAREVVKELKRPKLGQIWKTWRNRKNYAIAERMLKDIEEWVLADIEDDTFMELDSKYQRAHDNYFASNNIAVRVPLAYQPNNQDIKREAFVEGITLNKILKLKLSGRPIEQLIREEEAKKIAHDAEFDRQVEVFLRQAQAQGLTLEEIFMHSTEAAIEDYARHLVEPVFKNQDGSAVYVLHSDMHFGNLIAGPDLKTVYPIDRNLYLQLSAEDVTLVRKIMSTENNGNLLRSIVDYFLALPENQDNPINQGRAWRRTLLMLQIARKIKLSGDRSPLTMMMIILRELESQRIKIPLRMRIMFKNLISVNAMLRDARLGTFESLLDRAVRQGHSRIVNLLGRMDDRFIRRQFQDRQLQERLLAIYAGQERYDVLTVAGWTDEQIFTMFNQNPDLANRPTPQEPPATEGTSDIAPSPLAGGRPIDKVVLDAAAVGRDELPSPNIIGEVAELVKPENREILRATLRAILTWPDPKVKEEARNGIIQLSDNNPDLNQMLDALKLEQEQIASQTQGAGQPQGLSADNPTETAPAPSFNQYTPDTHGGVDLRVLPTVVQPAVGLVNNPQITHLNINLEEELIQIEKMLSAEIMPSAERMRDFVLASCQAKDKASIDKARNCLAEVLRLEEEQVLPTNAAEKDLILALEVV